jgi:hypothetical protein
MLNFVNTSSTELTQNKLNIKSSQIDIVLPYTDKRKMLDTVTILSKRATEPGQIICVEDNASWGFVRIANTIFKASQAPFFVYLAQDAFPGRHWLKIALNTLQKNQKALLAFNDGKWFGQLASFGMIQRQWALSIYNGNLFHPEYQSHYADTELTIIAEHQNQLVYQPNAVLIEVDPNKDNKSTNINDKKQFQKRYKLGFDFQVTNLELLRKFS